jgi:hypothetical protein
MARSPRPTARKRGSVTVCFSATAEVIVRTSRDRLLRDFELDQARVLQKLPKEEFEKVTEVVVRCFVERQLGLKGLEAAARRELSIRAIRLSVQRYSQGLLAGQISPVEYFKRFYVKLFLRCGLPAQAICIVDPNLHRVAKKMGEYPMLTNALESAHRPEHPPH